MDITDNNRLISDTIMETIYDDIETGVKKDIETYVFGDIVTDCGFPRHTILQHLHGCFLNYVANRTGEFKDPKKAGKKAGLCASICRDLLETKAVNQEKKDC